MCVRARSCVWWVTAPPPHQLCIPHYGHAGAAPSCAWALACVWLPPRSRDPMACLGTCVCVLPAWARQIPNPAPGDFPEAGDMGELQEQFVVALVEMHFLDACTMLAQTLDAPENRTFVLLLLDIFAFAFQRYWGGDGSELLVAWKAAEARAARATASASGCVERHACACMCMCACRRGTSLRAPAHA